MKKNPPLPWKSVFLKTHKVFQCTADILERVDPFVKNVLFCLFQGKNCGSDKEEHSRKAERYVSQFILSKEDTRSQSWCDCGHTLTEVDTFHKFHSEQTTFRTK